MNVVKSYCTPHQPDHFDYGAKFSAQSLSLLNQLRFQSIACRAEKHLEFYEACRLIQAEKSLAVESLVDALVRILGQAIDIAPTFHAPGSSELSFDEKWLLQIFEQASCDDFDSVLFLVKRRVNRHKQRSFLMLAINLVKAKSTK